jgi:DNA (cytosine-5)-methyltransferase 3A
MRVLSLFDGISCCRVALERAGIEVQTYYASEIDKHAIAISKKNYPDIVQLGSVVGLTPPEDIDLLIGGSPCQDLSIAKKDRKGLDGERSGLFWEYVRIKDECKPTYFILENVASMPKKDRDIITTTLGVQPVLFNASLVSAQSRKRLFWTNLKFELPEDRGILLRDILQPDAEVDERMVVDGKAFCLTASYQGAIESI